MSPAPRPTAGYDRITIFAQLRDFGAHTVILIFLTDDEGRAAAEKVCRHICSALDAFQVSPDNLSYILKALLETQPFVTLDVFLLSPSPHGIHYRFDMDFTMGPSLESVDPTILQKWASRDPQTRYPLLGKCLSMFGKKNNEEQNEISPLFLSMLDNAPDKRLFLGDLWDRVHPRSWGGSLAHILIQRKAQVMKLAEHSDAQVRACGQAKLRLNSIAGSRMRVDMIVRAKRALSESYQTGIRLSLRFRSTQAFAVEPRPVETANASLPSSEHRAGIFDPAGARLGLFGGRDPVDPISARIGRDVRP